MKTCSVCRAAKSEVEFYPERRNRSGIRSYCKECGRGKARAFYRRFPDRYKENARAWARSHPEKYVEHIRQQNEKRYDIKMAWQKAHPEIARETQYRRRARLKSVQTVRFTKADLRARLSMFGNLCWICRGPMQAVDHVKPLNAGGAHMLCNLRPICKICNAKKGHRWPLSAVYARFAKADLTVVA